MINPPNVDGCSSVPDDEDDDVNDGERDKRSEVAGGNVDVTGEVFVPIGEGVGEVDVGFVGRTGVLGGKAYGVG